MNKFIKMVLPLCFVVAGCKKTAPACDNPAVMSTAQQIVRKVSASNLLIAMSGDSVSLTYPVEYEFDSDHNIRTCNVTLNFGDNSSQTQYTVQWQDKDQTRIWVQFATEN